MMKKEKKVKVLKIEKLIYGLIIFVAVMIPIANVFSKALLLEKLEKKINRQVGINDSLNMQINELASLDKIQAVANELGLSYNNDNIKLITSN